MDGPDVHFRQGTVYETASGIPVYVRQGLNPEGDYLYPILIVSRISVFKAVPTALGATCQYTEARLKAI